MLSVLTRIMLIGFSFSTFTSSTHTWLPDKPIYHFPQQARVLADKVHERLQKNFAQKKKYTIDLEFQQFDNMPGSTGDELKTVFSAELSQYPEIEVQLNGNEYQKIVKKWSDYCKVGNCSIGRLFTTLKSYDYIVRCKWESIEAQRSGFFECDIESIRGHYQSKVSEEVYLPNYITQYEQEQKYKYYGIRIGSLLAIIFLLTLAGMKTVSVVREKAVQKKITQISDEIDQLINNGEYKRANELVVHYIKLASTNPRLKDLQAKLLSCIMEQDTGDPELAQRRLKIRNNIEQIVADINDLMKRGRYVDAAEQINYDLGIDPANPALKGLKGTLDALLASMGVKTAKEAVEALLKKQSLYNKAKSLAQSGDIKGSKKVLAEYNQLASALPSSHENTTAIGSVDQSPTTMHALASKEGIESEIEGIIKAKYQSFLAEVNQALMQGRRSEAVGLIDKYLRENSDEQNLGLIKLYKMLQKYGESKKLYMVSTSMDKVLHLYFTHSLKIGRDDTNDLIPDSMGVSRKHLNIEISGDGVFAEDVGSRFGTFINDKKIEPHNPVELAHLDHILLADNFPIDVKITSDVNTGEVENAIFAMKDFTVILIKNSLRIGFENGGIMLKGKGEGGFTIKSYSGMGFIVDTDEHVRVDNMSCSEPVPLLPETNIIVSDKVISTTL